MLLINSRTAGIRQARSIHAPGNVSSRLPGLRECRVDEPRLALGHFDQLGTKAGHAIRVILHDELPIALIDVLDACGRRHAENVPPGPLPVPGRCVRVLASSLPTSRVLFGGLARTRGRLFGSPPAYGVVGCRFAEARPAPPIDFHKANPPQGPPVASEHR